MDDTSEGTNSWRDVARSWAVNFGPVTVQPGKYENLQEQPGVLFRGVGILNNGRGSVAGLRVMGIFVGQKPQISSWGQEGMALADFFAECARRQSEELAKLSNGGDLRGVGQGRGLGMDVCDPALFITLLLKNVGEVPRECAVAIHGVAILRERW